MVSRFIQKALSFLVDEVSAQAHVLWFIATVILFGFAYTLLTPIGHGIGQNLTPLSDTTFLTGIYFSIVTISSLGYGHIHPMGFSKALACIEVLMGLGVMGILIAKVTSRRLSYHVSRLFSSDAQTRLESLAREFSASHSAITAIMPRLGTTYQGTPGSTSPPGDSRHAAVADFRDAISELRTRCLALYDYLSLEIPQGNYFQSVPCSTVVLTSPP